jgi:predicted DNA-binding transcriptional regulator AlpA
MMRKSHRKSPPVLPGQLDMFASAPEAREIKPIAKPRAGASSSKGSASKSRSVKAAPAVKNAASSAVLRVQDAAMRVGLSISTLNKMRGDGRGPRFIKLTGKIVGYSIDDLDAWVEKRRRLDEGSQRR